jgi:hypothetical protein
MSIISRLSDGDKNLVFAVREHYGLKEYSDSQIISAWRQYMRRGEARFFTAILREAHNDDGGGTKE